MRKKSNFAFIMAVFTTGIVTFAAISVKLGFNRNFLQGLLKFWAISYSWLFPLLVIAQKVQAFAD